MGIVVGDLRHEVEGLTQVSKGLNALRERLKVDLDLKMELDNQLSCLTDSVYKDSALGVLKKAEDSVNHLIDYYNAIADSAEVRVPIELYRG